MTVGTGSDWMVLLLGIFLAILSLVFLLGHGSKLIAGYHAASPVEKSKYNEKKLGHILGIGLGIMAILVWMKALFEHSLPVFFDSIVIGVVLIDVMAMLVLINLASKK